MTFTKNESNDSAVPLGDSAGTGSSAAEAGERFRLDIPSLFRQEPVESKEPVRLAHAGSGSLAQGSDIENTAQGEKARTDGRADSPGEKPRARIEKSSTGDRATEKIGDKQFSDFARSNGLEMRKTPDNKIEFSLMNRGEKLVLGNVEPNRGGMEKIAKSLKEFAELKKWDIEQRFGVRFAAPGGEQKLHQQVQVGDSPPRPGKELNLREPKLRELLGVEAGLEKANPSHRSEDGAKPLTFYFLKDSTYYKGAHGVASYDPKVNGGPAVVVEPTSLDKSVITEKDRKDRNYTDHRSIESVIIHELGHNTEDRLIKNPEEKAEIYRQMGWTPIPGIPAAPNGEQQWMLKGPNGTGFAPAGLAPGDWVRFDRNGREQGKIHPDQAARLAEVKPPTRYFEGPHEVLAEGLTMLRLGEQHRSHLLNNDSNLYQRIKDFDQRELDKSYGQGKFMRSYSGEVVSQSTENLRILLEREEKEKRSALPVRGK